MSLPTINHKPLDLWLLRKEVHKMGGYDVVSNAIFGLVGSNPNLSLQVTKNKKWSDLGRILGYGGVPGLSTQLKNSYTRVVLPFEQFSDRVKNLQSTPPTTHELKTHTNIQSVKTSAAGPSTEGDDNSPPSSPLSATSSPLSEPPDESESKDMSERRSESAKPRRSPRTGSQEQTSRAFGAFPFSLRILTYP